MPRRGLTPETALAVRLSAICSRHRFTRDPAPVVAELLATAGDRLDILARECGQWARYYASADTGPLCAALLRDIPGSVEWAAPGHGLG